MLLKIDVYAPMRKQHAEPEEGEEKDPWSEARHICIIMKWKMGRRSRHRGVKLSSDVT